MFFYRHVLKKEFGDLKEIPRAKRTKYVPSVLSRKEIDDIIDILAYPVSLVAKLLYGSGLRLNEGYAEYVLTAEYYLKEALEFETDNRKIHNLLNKIVPKTLPVLNYREDVSLAIAGFSRERKALIMTLSNCRIAFNSGSC